MPFVKLDCGLLNSTLWIDRDAREVFITALLMAEPQEFLVSQKQICVLSLDETGFEAPPGWYGFVAAAGSGIVRFAGLEREAGMAALVRLGDSDPESRSSDFAGRRLIRVDGGYIVLNFCKYREKDATTADRSKRWRERQREKRHAVSVTATRVIRHQAEAEAEAEADKEIQPSFPEVEPTTIIERVFGAYKQIMGKNGTYTLTPQRMKQGLRCYRHAVKVGKYNPEEAMTTAVNNLAASDFHMARGLHKGKTQYNGWEHIFRSVEKFEEWIQ